MNDAATSPARSSAEIEVSIPHQVASNSAPPLVSVVIAAYNCEAYIDATLQSIFDQTYPNIETIVVDDGSTDSTSAILAGYNDRIKYIKQRNGGIAAARNTGIQHASGKYIALMDSDDICHAQRLATQVAVLESEPDVVLCSSDFSAFRGNVTFESSHISSYYSQVREQRNGACGLYREESKVDLERRPWFGKAGPPKARICKGRPYQALIWGNFIHPPTIMVRKTAAQQAGDFNSELKHSADYDWIIRISKLGKVAYIDLPLLKYRYHDAQDSALKNAGPVNRETVRILERVAAADPQLVRRHPWRYRRRIGACHLHAAYAYIEKDRRLAWMELLLSARNLVWTALSCRVAAKLLLPTRMQEWLRQRTQRNKT